MINVSRLVSAGVSHLSVRALPPLAVSVLGVREFGQSLWAFSCLDELALEQSIIGSITPHGVSWERIKSQEGEGKSGCMRFCEAAWTILLTGRDPAHAMHATTYLSLFYQIIELWIQSSGLCFCQFSIPSTTP